MLGGSEFRDGDGTPIAITGRKQRILLVMLALGEGRPVSRAALVEALWGEAPPRDPDHALQAHVSRLRVVLRTEIFLSATGYHLAAGSVHLDAARFQQLRGRGRELLDSGRPGEAVEPLAAALALWRGPVFADLRDVGPLVPVAAKLDEAWHGARVDHAEAELRTRGGGGTLVSDLQELVTRFPLREDYWAQLMRALHLEGRLGEALETHARAGQVLAAELGTGPGQLLSDVHEEMLRGTAVAPYDAGARPAVPPSRADSAITLAGRERELRVLEEAWAGAERGIRLVTISGDPGIGKTRLAREFTDRLRARGIEVLMGHCEPATAAPYQPFMEVLRSNVAGLQGPDLVRRLGEGADALVRLLPELRERLAPAAEAPAADPGTDLHRTFVAASSWLQAASSVTPVVIFIDDLHWADRQTLLLLRHLLRRPQAARALLVVTVRDREFAAGDGTSDLLALFLRQSDGVHHLPLTGLDDDDVSVLLAAELGSAPVPSEQLATWVATISAGNPLFVIELARHLAGRRTFQLGDPAAELVPTGVREVIETRLAAFPDSFRAILSRAAVIGTEFDPLVLRITCAVTEHELDEFLAAATYARLIEAAGGTRLRHAFAHELVRSVIYETIAPMRRAAIHREVAEATEQAYAGDLAAHHADLAHHFASGASTGSSERAVHYLMLSGDDAAQRQALSVALAHYRRALELLPRDALWSLRCDLLTILGVTASQAGDPSYRSTLLDAARLATENGDVRRLTDAVVANSRGWWSSTAAIDRERVAFIESALATAEAGDSRTRIQLLASWSLENVRDETQRHRVFARVEEAVALAEELGDDYLLARTLADHYAVAYATFQDPRECVATCRRILDLATRRADPGLRLTGMIGLAQASMTSGDFEVADRALAESLELGEALDLPPRLWLAKGWQAMTVGTRGDLARSEQLAGEAGELGLRWEQPDALTWFAGQLYSIRLLQGRLHEIIDAIEDQAATQADGIPAWRCAHAYALAECGRHEEAAAILGELWDRGFERLPVDMLWLHAMVFLSGTATALHHTDASDLLYRMLAPYSGLMAHNGTIDAGPVDLALAQTALATGRSADFEKHLLGAEALCQRIRAPIWLARVRALAASSVRR